MTITLFAEDGPNPRILGFGTAPEGASSFDSYYSHTITETHGWQNTKAIQLKAPSPEAATRLVASWLAGFPAYETVDPARVSTIGVFE